METLKQEHEIMVSVCCITYNHENYIADALEGFLNQETDFEYEILVHEDASTDGTADVIRDYMKKYPGRLNVIFQTENQYSKGVRVSALLYELARGKYIAVCEGDDYWIDNKKLQKQVEYFESHPECTFCFTNGYVSDQETGEKMQFVPYHKEQEKYYTGESKVVTLDNSYEMYFIPTASFMYPKRCWNEKPEYYWDDNCPAGDLRMRLYFTAMGYSYFIDEKTCVYRKNVQGSRMTVWKKSSRDSICKRELNVIKLLENVERFSEYKYSDGLKPFKQMHFKRIVNNATSFDLLKIDGCREIFQEMSLKRKACVILKIIIPERAIKVVKGIVKK